MLEPHPLGEAKRQETRFQPCQLHLTTASTFRGSGHAHTDSNSSRMVPVMEAPLLAVRDLEITFSGTRGETQAVKGLTFSIQPGEIVALVGESGSGKSATALALTNLLPPPPECRVRGRVEFEGEDLLRLPRRHLRKLRGGAIGYIFQEPSASLNPVFTIGAQVREAIQLHRPDIKNSKAAAIEALDAVGIEDAAARYSAYPSELSGGMLQRVMIAMAVACRPRLLIADEPTTALDATVQRMILDQLQTLREMTGTAILLITHDLGILKGLADRVFVLYEGHLVEEGQTSMVLSQPKHPYTRALIACVPRLGDGQRVLRTISAEERATF